MTTAASSTFTKPSVQDRIAHRAFAQMIQMIHLANHRKTKEKGDPKVGGHPASCASSLFIQSALHLDVARPEDYMAIKPHASPMDHALRHQLQLMRHSAKVDWFKGGDSEAWFTEEEAKAAMIGLRAFPTEENPVTFQSYHAASDPDCFHFLPTGTVGIPPVSLAYVALAYRYAASHGHEVPENAHFWALIGDSEFREGSLFEVMPEVAERELGNVTWILDYNRQNLDGTRANNESGLAHHDCDRIEGTATANGWRVIHLRHGSLRLLLFAKGEAGSALRQVIEKHMSDYEFQMLLLARNPQATRELWTSKNEACAPLLDGLTDQDVLNALFDVAGHCYETVRNALEHSRTNDKKPTFVIVHTLKGWGMESLANPANHSSQPSKKEIQTILERVDLSLDDPFALFAEGSEERNFLIARRDEFRDGQDRQRALCERNRAKFAEALEEAGSMPDDLGVNTSMMRMAHTQWSWGQLSAKLMRLGGADATPAKLSDGEKGWGPAAEMVLTMSPDVSSSTNISSSVNQRVYGPGANDAQMETDLGIEYKHPEMVAKDTALTRHVRFEIVEANAMCAVGSFGQMGAFTGVPLYPMMTVYDFFLKRALDQMYYSIYWGGSFMVLGTPAGVSLSAEGAQHSWKSDIQMPGLITWEPSFAQEMDWILSESLRRHVNGDYAGRNAVLVRGSTRELPQALLLDWTRRQAKSKASLPGTALRPANAPEGWTEGVDESTIPALDDATLTARIRENCLKGAYKLIDWIGYVGYEPGDNVVNLFAMGCLVPEAVAAAEQLLERGVFANLVVISSPELLLGILGENSGYQHLIEGLGINGDLHATESAGASQAGLVSIAGRRIPIVALVDGEAGLLDNIGSIVGVKQRTQAVRKFSKCGRPSQVYKYHKLDPDSVVEAAGQVLSETALENLQVSPALLERLNTGNTSSRPNWRELW